MLHEHERTYSVVGRLGQPPFGRGVRENYRVVATALEAGLRRLGLDLHAEDNPRVSLAAQHPDRHGAGPACFGSLSSHEISIRRLKLVGSAQLRRRGAFLQHGSILLRSDAGRLARAVGTREPPTGFTDLERAMGRPIDPSRLDRLLIEAFEACFSARLQPAELTAEELDRATWLRRRKYGSTEWTLEARAPSIGLVSRIRSHVHILPALPAAGCVASSRNTPGIPSSKRLASDANGSPEYTHDF